MSNLFVYGTLKKGYSNQYFLRHATLVGDAKLFKYDMYDAGGFPCIVPGTGIIYGELYKDIKDFSSLDRLEGYQSHKVKDSMFIRKLINVIGDKGKSVLTYVYIWNDEIKNFKKIGSGKWR